MAHNINRWLKVDNDDAWITLVITLPETRDDVVFTFFVAAVSVATVVVVRCVGGWHWQRNKCYFDKVSDMRSVEKRQHKQTESTEPDTHTDTHSHTHEIYEYAKVRKTECKICALCVVCKY